MRWEVRKTSASNISIKTQMLHACTMFAPANVILLRFSAGSALCSSARYHFSSLRGGFRARRQSKTTTQQSAENQPKWKRKRMKRKCEKVKKKYGWEKNVHRISLMAWFEFLNMLFELLMIFCVLWHVTRKLWFCIRRRAKVWRTRRPPAEGDGDSETEGQIISKCLPFRSREWVCFDWLPLCN